MPRTLVEKLRATARKWRVQNQHTTGVVLIFEGAVYGWKNCLRDAAHEQPNAFAVDADGHVFVAEGGNSYDGAKCWSVYKTTVDIEDLTN
jgi:hypothetical protein